MQNSFGFDVRIRARFLLCIASSFENAVRHAALHVPKEFRITAKAVHRAPAKEQLERGTPPPSVPLTFVKQLARRLVSLYDQSVDLAARMHEWQHETSKQMKISFELAGVDDAAGNRVCVRSPKVACICREVTSQPIERG